MFCAWVYGKFSGFLSKVAVDLIYTVVLSTNERKLKVKRGALLTDETIQLFS